MKKLLALAAAVLVCLCASAKVVVSGDAIMDSKSWTVTPAQAQSLRNSISSSFKSMFGGPGKPFFVSAGLNRDEKGGWHRDFIAYEALDEYYGDFLRFFAKYAVDVYYKDGKILIEVRSRIVYLGDKEKTPYKPQPIYTLTNCYPIKKEPAKAFTCELTKAQTEKIFKTVSARITSFLKDCDSVVK